MTCDAHRDVMVSLAERLQSLTELVPRDKPVAYVDYPFHLNVGDLLINMGTEKWFGEYGYDVVFRRSVFDFDVRQLRALPPDTTIVLHGGGNFGDIWDIHQKLRERVAAALPSHRIVLFPQSVHFSSAERAAEAAAIFSRNENLHICVRDEFSADYVSAAFSNPVYLFPDMAHQLWPMATGTIGEADGRPPLYLFRADKEAAPGIANDAGTSSIDWEDLMTARHITLYKAVKRWVEATAAVGGSATNHHLWYPVRDRIVTAMAGHLAEADHVVTDRLHGMIFSALVGREVIFHDNNYGKLRRYYDTWLRGSFARPVAGSTDIEPGVPVRQ